jgi:hypothetical protein
MTWFRMHFQRYLERKPWDFCWRIGVESTVVSLLVAILLVSIFGEGTRREFLNLSIVTSFFLLLIIAPPIETLLFQALPIFFVRLLKGSIRTQVLISTILFAAGHFPEGLVTSISAGIIGGLYFGFTYAHWRLKSIWQSFWITTVCHGIHNGIAFVLLAICGNWA